jgi:short-subunit dehydrogenase
MSFWHQKVALVTGGSRGLGLAIARAAVAAGCRVIITARDQEQLAAAAAAISTSDQKCGWLPADITQQDQVDALVAETLRLHGRIDVLVNCAGKSDRGHIGEISAAQFRELLELNFLSAVRMTHACLPPLLEAGGHVVHIGSLASKAAAPYLGAYAASKFPLAAYAQQLRLELGPQGLHTLLVCPGPIQREDAGSRYDLQAAELPASARQPGGGIKLSKINPDWLARRILTACERRHAELIVPGRVKLLFAISQLWPAVGDWIIRRITKHE